MTELERCDEEIRDHEANLRTGHKDVAGIFRALLDWREERRLLIESGKRILADGAARNDGED
jgi:hypothetical protein